mgnify:FL=1
MSNAYVVDDYWDDEYCEADAVIGSLSDADIARIAAAVLAALQATSIPVNVKKVNDLTVVGQGLAPPNHWRPE